MAKKAPKELPCHSIQDIIVRSAVPYLVQLGLGFNMNVLQRDSVYTADTAEWSPIRICFVQLTTQAALKEASTIICYIILIGKPTINTVSIDGELMIENIKCKELLFDRLAPFLFYAEYHRQERIC